MPAWQNAGQSVALHGVSSFTVCRSSRNALMVRHPRLTLLSLCVLQYGLMSNLDVGTEHLRWMGDTRFLLGLLWVSGCTQYVRANACICLSSRQGGCVKQTQLGVAPAAAAAMGSFSNCAVWMVDTRLLLCCCG